LVIILRASFVFLQLFALLRLARKLIFTNRHL
jgi:hypothetical protein